MATTKFKDMPVHLSGDFIATGAAAPDFELVKTDLGTLSLSSLKGKRVILNIFPSLDTGVCAMSVRKFNSWQHRCPTRWCWPYRRIFRSPTRVSAP